jgi:hypothetical protein
MGPGGSEPIVRSRTGGERKTNDTLSEMQFFTESLILAQDERWRRA